jgi:hypothetical protein
MHKYREHMVSVHDVLYMQQQRLLRQDVLLLLSSFAGPNVETVQRQCLLRLRSRFAAECCAGQACTEWLPQKHDVVM